MSQYILKKDDKTVTIVQAGKKWNYKKEFGYNIIENFEIDDSKLSELLSELEELEYEIIERPEPIVKKQKEIIYSSGWINTSGSNNP